MTRHALLPRHPLPLRCRSPMAQIMSVCVMTMGLIHSAFGHPTSQPIRLLSETIAAEHAMAPALPQLRVVRGGDAQGPTASALARLVYPNGTQFIPRGVNYIRLSGDLGTDGKGAGYHSTFSPLWYKGNRTHTIAALDRLSTVGFNMLRVFIDHGDWSRTDAVGHNATTLSGPYMDNVADFIQLASARGMYVSPTLETIPNTFGLNTMGHCQTPSAVYPYPNNLILDPDCVLQKGAYAREFLAQLKARLPSGWISGIGWLSIENEACVSTDISPFAPTNASDSFAACGSTFSMSNSTQRQQAFDCSAVYWADTVAQYAKEASADTLVGVGMFTYAAVGRPHGPQGLPRGSADARVPLRPAVLSKECKHLDVLDVHVYQTPGWTTLKADLDSSEWPSIDVSAMPLIMGEFGAFRVNPAQFPTAAGAASAMLQQVIDACSFNFQGWMFWTYDTVEQPRLWDFVTAPDLWQALSPRLHPNPCA
eukprot:m.212110 g.212110  ORF g.212110 m.212110 type:complete len:480 (+) comp25935_c0_seq1:101-1540(+)